MSARCHNCDRAWPTDEEVRLRGEVLAERARADKAEACFAAMRAHRNANRDMGTYCDTNSDGYSVAKASLYASYETLRAIGVEP